MRLFLFLLINFTICFSAISQKHTLIGYGCGYAGIPTDNIIMFDGMLSRSDFNSIKNNLKSVNPGIQFLAVIASEILERRGSIKFSEEDENQIKKIYLSERLVDVCSGCMASNKHSLKDMLEIRSKYPYRRFAEERMEEILSKK